MSDFKAVLFDYDDTLANTYPARVIAAENAIKGVLDPDLDMKRIMREWAGRPQIEIFTDLSDPEKAEAMMQSYARWYWEEGTFQVSLFPGVTDMLSRLKADGLTLAVVTSKARRLERDGKPYGATVEMERLGLDSNFDLVVGHEDVQEAKPSPRPILHALETLGLSAEHAVMVGDSHIDMTAAQRAGVRSAGAAWGTLARDLLEQAEPDYILESPADLFAVVE